MVAEGEAVGAGATLVILEPVKTENPVPTEGPGTVEVITVAEGDLIAVIA
ncbi:biotin/lipoyl-containing protein [Yinghuangia sp. YIM S09857]